MFQAHKDPILKPWQYPQGNIARPDRECNSQPHLCPARSKSLQDMSRRQRRWRSRGDNIFLGDKASTLQLCHCPRRRKTPEGRDRSPMMKKLPTSRNDPQGMENNSMQPE
jgi:hypothetical protein